MARIRSIKPGCFTSEDVTALTLRERWTWVGMWTHADDHGRAKDNAKLIHAAVWPLEDGVTPAEVEADLKALRRKGRIVRYEVDGVSVVAIVGWHDHQKINRPADSKLPPPPPGTHKRVCTHGAFTEEAVSDHGPLTGGGEGEQGGEQGRGVLRTPEPPSRCPRHLNSTDDAPCRACGDARRAHDRWIRAQKSKPTPTAVPDPSEPRCTVDGHERYIASNCRGCAADRKAAS